MSTFFETYMPLSNFVNTVWVHCPNCSGLAKITTDVPPLSEQKGHTEIYYDEVYIAWKRATFNCLYCAKRMQTVRYYGIDQDGFITSNQELVKKYWWGPLVVFAFDHKCTHCQYKTHYHYKKALNSSDHIQDYHHFTCVNCQLHIRSKFYYRLTPNTEFGIDPIFGLPLWMVANFRKEILWLYNLEHLQVLKKYVVATQRKISYTGSYLNHKERMSPHRQSFSKNLPSWIKSATNREKIVALLIKMEARFWADLALYD